MRRSIPGHLALTLALTMAAVGCDSGDSTTTPTPTTPTTTVTETFSGSIGVNGAATFTFTTATSGTVTASLRTLAPVSTAQVGLALGTWNGIICQVVLANDRTQQGTTVTGQANAAGTLCARIYDVGQLTGTATFEIVVVHP